MTFYVQENGRYRPASYDEWLAADGQVSTSIAVAKASFAGHQITVSTVFLSIGPYPGGQYETMMFVDGEGLGQLRCESLAEAKMQHDEGMFLAEKYISGLSLPSAP